MTALVAQYTQFGSNFSLPIVNQPSMKAPLAETQGSSRLAGRLHQTFLIGGFKDVHLSNGYRLGRTSGSQQFRESYLDDRLCGCQKPRKEGGKATGYLCWRGKRRLEQAEPKRKAYRGGTQGTNL